MVDSIKGSTPVQGTASSTKSQKQTKTGSAKALTENFNNLSSAKVVENVSRNSEAVVSVGKIKNSDKVARTLRDLNDAVSHSTLALDALGRISETAEAETNGQALQSLAGDIDQLRGSIKSVLGELKGRIETAEVMSENFSASSSRIKDVDAAQSKAINFSNDADTNGANAIDAHKGLTPERVIELLSE